MATIFFNSSLPRSGSTLLQNILAQNPNIYTTPTSGIAELLLMGRNIRTNSDAFMAQDDGTMREAFRGFCKGGIDGYFKNITDKPYIIDKSRLWMDNINFINFFYPSPRIICIIRDPRAIFASAEKAIKKNPDKSPNISDGTPLSNITLEQRVYWHMKNSFIGTSLMTLKEMIYQKNDKKVLFLKYENLTQNPQQEMDRIYQYLGIPYYNHDFNNIQQLTHENDIIHGIFGDHKIQSKLEYKEPNFEEVLTLPVSNLIKEEYKWFYEWFYYN